VTTMAAGVTTNATAGQRVGRSFARLALPAFTAVAIGYLLIPIIVMFIFSFNDYQGKFNFIWSGFTLAAWSSPWPGPGCPTRSGSASSSRHCPRSSRRSSGRWSASP